MLFICLLFGFFSSILCAGNLQRNPQGCSFFQFLQQLFDFLGRIRLGVVCLAPIGGRRRHLRQQRRKFQLGEELTAGFSIGLARGHDLEVQLNGHIAVNRDLLFAVENLLAVVQQRLTVGLFLNFGGVLESIFQRPEAADNLDRTFVPNSRRSGDVINRVAAQRHHVNHLLGTHSQDLFHLGGIADQVVFGRIEHADFVVHQLQHVFVTGNHIHGMARGRGLARQGPNYIIGLKAR